MFSRIEQMAITVVKMPINAKPSTVHIKPRTKRSFKLGSMAEYLMASLDAEDEGRVIVFLRSEGIVGHLVDARKLEEGAVVALVVLDPCGSLFEAA